MIKAEDNLLSRVQTYGILAIRSFGETHRVLCGQGGHYGQSGQGGRKEISKRDAYSTQMSVTEIA